MYDSKPRDREGEPIEFVVPEAINTTASRTEDNEPGSRTLLPDWMPEGKGAFASVAAIAVVEAVVLLWVVALYAL